jgi:phospholipase D1/2
VVPLTPDPNLLLYPEDRMRLTHAALARLAQSPRVGFFGLVHEDDPGRIIYVHAKLLIADDRVVQLGSANLWPPSYSRDSELNVTVWDEALAVDTRRRLWREHLLDQEATGLDDWRRLAADARAARVAGRRAASRLAEIDPASYYVFAAGTVAPWRDAQERR